MPEGDTIHRAAARVREAILGEAIERFSAPRTQPPHPRAGETVDAVEAEGKHLLITFSGGLLLRTHMGMTGTWRIVRRPDPWPRPAHLARAAITTARIEAVCFAAPTVELVPAAGPSPTAHLGPDLCRADADLDEVLRRMAGLDPRTPVLDVLLDQRVAAGIGNVYKSEVLWACQVHPETPIDAVDATTRLALVTTASRQLRSNLGSGRRTTVGLRSGSGQYGVYGRVRQPCLRCHTPIVTARLGAQGRSTYWCPRCQVRPTG